MALHSIKVKAFTGNFLSESSESLSFVKIDPNIICSAIKSVSKQMILFFLRLRFCDVLEHVYW